eukprot:scaffold98355_cov78-Phaeocystis_antarctica.AAC.2
MGTKPAKLAHHPSWPTKAAKPGLCPRDRRHVCRKVSFAAGEPKLLKWGLPGRGSNLLKYRPWRLWLYEQFMRVYILY